MCDPVTISLAVAGAAASYVGQQQAASAQEASNASARQLSIQNQDIQIKSLQNAEDEDSRRASEALIDNQKSAQAARATAQVSAGESGVSGLSIDSLLQDLSMQESLNKQDILQTQDFGQRQRQLDREGVGITTSSQINQLPVVEYPSFLEHAASVGTAAYGSYQKKQEQTRQKQKV